MSKDVLVSKIKLHRIRTKRFGIKPDELRKTDIKMSFIIGNNDTENLDMIQQDADDTM